MHAPVIAQEGHKEAGKNHPDFEQRTWLLIEPAVDVVQVRFLLLVDSLQGLGGMPLEIPLPPANFLAREINTPQDPDNNTDLEQRKPEAVPVGDEEEDSPKDSD